MPFEEFLFEESTNRGEAEHSPAGGGRPGLRPVCPPRLCALSVPINATSGWDFLLCFVQRAQRQSQGEGRLLGDDLGTPRTYQCIWRPAERVSPRELLQKGLCCAGDWPQRRSGPSGHDVANHIHGSRFSSRYLTRFSSFLLFSDF